MSSVLSVCSDAIRSLLTQQGACRVAVASVHPVEDWAQHLYSRWLERGMHASMHYLENYPDLRADPSLLLPGAQSIICCAFAFSPAPSGMGARIAAYALGTDYHIVVRERLEIVAQYLRDEYGASARVCVDTAPLRERYWAMRSGLGFIGLNNHLIVPGVGSYLFLGEILTSLHLPPDSPLATDCGKCGRCVRACPTGALQPDGSVDARRCLSYLTIEHRGDFPPGTNLHGCLYGCDTCAAVCPHNAHASEQSVIEPLLPRPHLLTLTPEECRHMTQSQFSAIFSRSAIKRTKLAGLLRNARHLP